MSEYITILKFQLQKAAQQGIIPSNIIHDQNVMMNKQFGNLVRLLLGEIEKKQQLQFQLHSVAKNSVIFFLCNIYGENRGGK